MDTDKARRAFGRAAGIESELPMQAMLSCAGAKLFALIARVCAKSCAPTNNSEIIDTGSRAARAGFGACGLRVLQIHFLLVQKRDDGAATKCIGSASYQPKYLSVPQSRKLAVSKPRVRVAVTRGGVICPVCGQSSYSLGGIHPQCSVTLADAKRKKQLGVEKQAAAKRKSKIKVPERLVWNMKKCPKCSAKLHVRIKNCGCGYDFFATSR